MRRTCWAADLTVLFWAATSVTAILPPCAKGPLKPLDFPKPDPAGRLWPLPCTGCAPYTTTSAVSTTALVITTTTTTTTTIAPADLEVLTVDVDLANKVRCKNSSLAEDIARSLGVPANRVDIVPWSWTAKNPPSTESRCFCNQSMEYVYDVSPTNRSNPARIQMLTRDPCLVRRLRAMPEFYAESIANFLRIPKSRVIIEPPLIEGVIGQVPAPAPSSSSVSLLAVQRCSVTKEGNEEEKYTLHSIAPEFFSMVQTAVAQVLGEVEKVSRSLVGVSSSVSVPGPAPSPQPFAGPAPAPGPEPIKNRPWIAWWAIEILPPDATPYAEKVLAAFNNPRSNVSCLLPSTLARVPGLWHPLFQSISVNETRLPPPRERAVELGPHPGGVQGLPRNVEGEMLKRMNIINAYANAEIHDAVIVGSQIRQGESRILAAAKAHRDALHAHPALAPEIISESTVDDEPAWWFGPYAPRDNLLGQFHKSGFLAY